MFAAVLAGVGGAGRRTLLVVDDAHWADGATFDVLRFLGRRIADLPAMLLLTYRDDEAEDGHPLRNLLGGMTGAETVRLRLAPLTVDGVTAWRPVRRSMRLTSSGLRRVTRSLSPRCGDRSGVLVHRPWSTRCWRGWGS